MFDAQLHTHWVHAVFRWIKGLFITHSFKNPKRLFAPEVMNQKRCKYGMGTLLFQLLQQQGTRGWALAMPQSDTNALWDAGVFLHFHSKYSDVILFINLFVYLIS